MWLRVLRWREYAGTLAVITRVLVTRQEVREHPRHGSRGRKRGPVRRRPSQVLNVGQEPPGKCKRPLEAQEDEEMDSPPEPLEETLSCKPVLDL